MAWIKVWIGGWFGLSPGLFGGLSGSMPLVLALGLLGVLAAGGGFALASSTATSAPTLMVFGDSLSAGYGLDPGTGWVALLDNKLKTQASPKLKSWQVVNVSVSGETSAGGLSRLPAALAQYHPQLLLLELGANDGLRGEPVAAMRANLVQMIALGKAAHAQPVLFEMRIPSNYGPAYTEKFTQAFDEVARQENIELVPFFLMPLVAERARWFQDDGLHPNAAAQPALLDAVWKLLVPLLEKRSGGGAAS